MKKIIKTMAILLIVFVTIINVNASANSFYGIKSGKLDVRIWGQSSTDDGSSDGNSTDEIWGKSTQVNCYDQFTSTVALKQYTSIDGKAHVGSDLEHISDVSLGATGVTASANSVIVILTQGWKQECDGWSGHCSTYGCRSSVGATPSMITVNGTAYPISTN